MSQAGRLAQLAAHLLNQGGNLESTTGGVNINAAELTGALERRIESNRSAETALSLPTARSVAINTVRDAEAALTKIAGGAPATNLTDLEVASLEAIVEVTGRPASRFKAGVVQMPESGLGENDKWRTLVAIARSKINKAASSVGCISVKGPGGVMECVGTGWCTVGRLIVTNRHVVAEMVQSVEPSPAQWNIDASRQPTIDFDVSDDRARPRSFRITDIGYCSVDDDFDAAFLRAAHEADDLPAPLKLDWGLDSLGTKSPSAGGNTTFAGADVYVIGHPYRQLNSELTASVFGRADGVKRWSPGRIVQLNPKLPAFDHDCSTLGGNSGSCVLSAWDHSVVGMHFGGVEVDAQGKGSANLALALSRLGTHRLAAILKSGNTG